MKTRQINIQISEELYWKLEEIRVKERCENLSEIVERLLRESLGLQPIVSEFKKIQNDNIRAKIHECILKKFPNAKGEKLRDLQEVVYYMLSKGASRREAIKIRAKDKDVDPSTVQANITRGFGINTEELDRRLTRVLDCVREKYGNH